VAAGCRVGVLSRLADPDAGFRGFFAGSLDGGAVVMGSRLVLCCWVARVCRALGLRRFCWRWAAVRRGAVCAVLPKDSVGAASPGGLRGFLRAHESYCLIPAALARDDLSAVGHAAPVPNRFRCRT